MGKRKKEVGGGTNPAPPTTQKVKIVGVGKGDLDEITFKKKKE